MNKELKEQAHKEFDEVLQEALHYHNGELVSISNSHIHEHLDSLIDKTVQMTEERIVKMLEEEKPDLSTYNGKEMRFWQGFRKGIEHIISLITNKNDINK